ncbi:MAG: Na+/H+ antiporter NhaA [Rhodospirillales bacterium]|nr:Na+/H+ antiporter NhaA [Rhodospirillales bacterium]
MPLSALRDFFKMEASGGILLVLASAIALIVANSGWNAHYEALLKTYATIRIGDLDIHKPLILWINDGLMAIFFFLVGLEIKRELLEGELSSLSQAALPAIAAVGGMIVPAAIYAGINIGNPESLKGWAIPAATDIAFALGVLGLLGRRVPTSMKILLTAIAVFDDLGAIIVIALFYTDQLSLTALGWAGGALVALFVLNVAGVKKTAPYILLGILLWVCVLKSGVHATLAGVALAMAIPMRGGDPEQASPLKTLEHGIHPWVAYAVLPIFAFANAGVSFAGIGWGSFVEPVTLGISAGLFIGKQIGIFGMIWLTVRAGLARMPERANWTQVYGMSVLCGIGFTMSLFIGGLAWEHAHFDAPVRLGVITGSLLSAAVGSLVMLMAARGESAAD